ncbi:MAG: hydantoinase/oxoprolinase family protein, partial [Mesorhizobium sp.]
VSALGGLVADLRGDFIRTIFSPLSAASLPAIRQAFEVLAQEGRDWLAAQGHDATAQLNLSCDMRYVGQSYEIEVVLSQEWLADDDAAGIEQAFHRTHEQLYDFHDPEGAIELVNVRLSAIGAGPALSFPEIDEIDTATVPARRLPVYTGLSVETVDLHDRQTLVPGSTFHGPAVVVQEDTTFVIPAGTQARVDRHLNLLLTFAE